MSLANNMIFFESPSQLNEHNNDVAIFHPNPYSQTSQLPFKNKFDLPCFK